MILGGRPAQPREELRIGASRISDRSAFVGRRRERRLCNLRLGAERMSRSAFAARFTNKIGCAPMEYVSRWRMAQDALSRGEKPLDRIAIEIGYESASAFSTAFRRRVGRSPGAFARSCRDGDGVSR
jgi:AraC-like DNA-binding protein